MKRLHLTNGVIERPAVQQRPKFGECRENDMASYIFSRTLNGFTVLKNRYGDRGDVTSSVHINTLNQNHTRNIIPIGRWKISE